MPLKALLDRVYTQSMDGRTETCSLLYDVLYLLYSPPSEGSKQQGDVLRGFQGSGSFIVDNRTMETTTITMTTTTSEVGGVGGRRKRDEKKKKKSRETWDLSNMFRYEVETSWVTPVEMPAFPGDTAITTTTTASSSSSAHNLSTKNQAALSHRTSRRQPDNRHGCLLPDQCFRFWHVIDVATMLSLHDAMKQEEAAAGAADTVDREENDEENDDWEENEVEEADDEDDTTDNDDVDDDGRDMSTNVAATTGNSSSSSSVSLCFGGRENDLVRHIKTKSTSLSSSSSTSSSTSSSRVRGKNNLGHVMRELMEFEAYADQVQQGIMKNLEYTSSQPLFRLKMRPEVLCIRLQWPSSQMLR